GQHMNGEEVEIRSRRRVELPEGGGSIRQVRQRLPRLASEHFAYLRSFSAGEDGSLNQPASRPVGPKPPHQPRARFPPAGKGRICGWLHRMKDDAPFDQVRKVL